MGDLDSSINTQSHHGDIQDIRVYNVQLGGGRGGLGNKLWFLFLHTYISQERKLIFLLYKAPMAISGFSLPKSCWGFRISQSLENSSKNSAVLILYGFRVN